MASVDIRERLRLDLPWVAGLSVLVGSGIVVHRYGLGVDAHAYWLAGRAASAADVYAAPPGSVDAYLYSPAFTLALRPLAHLPWPVFLAVWMTATTTTLAWLLRPLGAARALPLLLACSFEILTGNINWLLALVAAVALRPRPRLGALSWTIPALTKVTPALGALAHLRRREWRALGLSVAAPVLIATIGYAADPAAWSAWLDFLLSHAAAAGGTLGGPWSPPPVVRIAAAVGLLWWGAGRGRTWTGPVAMILASPVWGFGALTILAALPRLAQARAGSEAGAGSEERPTAHPATPDAPD